MTKTPTRRRSAISAADAPAGTVVVPEVAQDPAIVAPPTERELAVVRAKVETRGGFNGSLIVAEYASGLDGDVKLSDLVNAFLEDIEAVHTGDLKQAEAMLFAQAQALQSMFVFTARQARHAEKVHQQDILMRMALKAQAQCRATIETLANIKNPPVVFARQANINQGGQQQINNAPPPVSPAAAPAAIGSDEAAPTIRASSRRRGLAE